jgi:hypothetical protein
VLYRARNRIERFFNRIKHSRRLATCYEKHAANFLAMLKLTAAHLWLRHNESVTQGLASSQPVLPQRTLVAPGMVSGAPSG